MPRAKLTQAEVNRMRKEHPEYFMNWGGNYKQFMPEPEKSPTVKVLKIESSSSIGLFYDVTYQDGVPIKCSCPGFVYRGKCKHVGGKK